MMQQRNGMDPQDQRNFIIAMALMIAFVFLYQTVVVNPEQNRRRAAEAAAAEQAAAEVTANPSAEVSADAAGDVPAITAPAAPVSVEEAITQSQRITFNADRVDGSLRLRGAVLDDLSLKDHYKTVERKEELRLLRPSSAEHSFYASWYWLGGGRAYAGPTDEWTQIGGGDLTTQNPVKLVLEKDGLTFERQISVDENYLFTYADTVTNTSAEPITLRSVGTVRRHGAWKEFLEATDPGSSGGTQLAHQGLIGVLGNRLKTRNYNNLSKGRGIKGDEDHRNDLTAGWLGFTDKYWMAALVPQQGMLFDAAFNLRGTNQDIMELTTVLDPVVISPGAVYSVNNQIFAGAKEYETVNAYKAAGIPRFDDSIDWGNILYYITRPFFALLNWLKTQIGSFGLAIMALTLIIKIPLVPLFNQSYKSMAKLRVLAEPMKEIQERFKGDPQRRQQEIMKLYQREKANPAAGCIPILFTIPIFFALYKTLYVTIEMRHTPFLWLPDLSAPDTLVLGNLFGLFPWATSLEIHALPIPINFLLGVGVLAILYGVSMAAIQSLSPPPPDPTQRTIMMALPFILMFVFGGFAAGLVLYWVWSNMLSLAQQYYIMRRNGVETEIDKLIKRLLGRAESPTE